MKTEQEYLKIISAKLDLYLKDVDRNYDSSKMTNSIISTIIQFFDCDYQKLISALDDLIIMKQSNHNMKFSDYDNKFDISDQMPISIKGFLSKGKPNLFFFMGDEEKPYAIVKTMANDFTDVYSVEISNNPISLTIYKKDASVMSDSYVYVEEYRYTGDECLSTKNMFAKTTPPKIGDISAIDFKNDSIEFFNFLTLLSAAMKNKNVDLSTISAFATDMMFINFYENLKNYNGNDKFLPVHDLIYLANKTLYNYDTVKVSDSVIIDKIESTTFSEESDTQKKQVVDVNIEGKEYKLVVVKSEGYMSVDVFDGEEKVSGAIIIASADGFSLFKSVPDADSKNHKKDSAAYVFNVTRNQVRFMTVSDDKLMQNTNRAIDSFITFEEDGSIKLVSSDSEKIKIKPLKNKSTTADVSVVSNQK